MFLARYELDRNRALDEDEIQHVLAELEGRTFGFGDGKSDKGSREYGSGGTADHINFQVYQEELEA